MTVITEVGRLLQTLLKTRDMSNSPQAINIKDLMDQIRSELRQASDSDSLYLPEFKAKSANFSEADGTKAGELAHCEHLLYLNRNHSISAALNPANIISHRGGIIGKAIVFFKRKLSALIRDAILKDYLQAEQDFLVHLVRHLNFNSRYVDLRDFDLFWQIIRKIDTDVSKALERIERIRDELISNSHTYQRNSDDNLNRLAGTFNSSLSLILPTQEKLKAEIQTLDSVVRGMESLMNVFSKNNTSETSSKEIKTQVPDLSYVLLENRFRGSESEISERQTFYSNYFKTATLPVLDVGCGRGELLMSFKANNIPASGIDLDQAMVTICNSKGLDVHKADLISFLRSCPDRSLGGLIALQVVEHLPQTILLEFIRLAAKKVIEGGTIIFETINPTSVTALSSNYFRDPTHVFPQHPDTLGFIISSSGLELKETKYLSPIPDSAQLKPLKPEVYMTPKWTEMLNLFNHNIEVLNSLLFGHQDFCVVAQVPHQVDILTSTHIDRQA